MPTSPIQIDFVAYGRDGGVLLLGEAKSRRGTSESWAAGLRRNMLSHGSLPESKYFLIATPERVYLWGQQAGNPGDPPEVTINAGTILQPYFNRLHQDPSQIGPEAFDYVVLTWLTDVAKGGERYILAPEGMQESSTSNLLGEFLKSLREAEIEMNPRQ